MIDKAIEIGSPWQGKNNEGDVKIEWSNHNRVHYSYVNTNGDNIGDVYDTSVSHFLEYFEPRTDMVNHPPHYKDASGVGCTEIVKHMMYFGGACFKYLYRCGSKWDDIEDLKKAVRCAELADDDRLINDESWLRAMYQVASHREGNIRDAMFSIRCQQWSDVIEYIDCEIQRLENMDVD